MEPNRLSGQLVEMGQAGSRDPFGMTQQRVHAEGGRAGMMRHDRHAPDNGTRTEVGEFLAEPGNQLQQGTSRRREARARSPLVGNDRSSAFARSPPARPAERSLRHIRVVSVANPKRSVKGCGAGLRPVGAICSQAGSWPARPGAERSDYANQDRRRGTNRLRPRRAGGRRTLPARGPASPSAACEHHGGRQLRSARPRG